MDRSIKGNVIFISNMTGTHNVQNVVWTPGMCSLADPAIKPDSTSSIVLHLLLVQDNTDFSPWSRTSKYLPLSWFTMV